MIYKGRTYSPLVIESIVLPPGQPCGRGGKLCPHGKVPGKRPAGCPSAYRAAYAEQAYKLCLLGAIDADMADFFGIGEATLNRWELAHLEFRESIKRGKSDADSNVAESLYRRATGYSHPDTHISNYQGEITVTNIVKHYPPDTAA
jgi:hypothetical protein